MRATTLIGITLLFLACGEGPGADAGDTETASATAAMSADFHIDLPGVSVMTADQMAADIRTLSSDEFEGRGPSSPGEEKTVAYLIDELEAAGLEPGNDGGFTQDVPLVSITVEGSPSLSIEGNGASSSFDFGTDYVAWTKRVVDGSALEGSELAFVGYGVVAPEYGWNDYEGLDVTGKTVVILVNDPGYATRDEALFRGFAMTYYGRWTYKFEEAARQGAAGAIVVHETGPAGYPWEVVNNSWTGPQFGLVAPDENMSRVAVEGWVTVETAEAIFQQAGQSYQELKERALQPDFQPVELGLTASVALDNAVERSVSRNVIATVPGSERPDEYVIYMAHWDHFGRGPDTLEDPIYNGAFDNATGTAGLLELARAYAGLEPAPARSVVFLAVTAEEQGLLGSAYYAADPVLPTHQTVAAINMDGMNVHGPMRDVTVVGFGASELDDVLERWAGPIGRVLRPDPEPEKGFYYRSDHFSFAKVGVPALYMDSGIDHVVHGPEWTMARREEYTAENYHKPSDEFDASWDLTGAIDDLHLLYAVGYDLATSEAWPNWRDGNEFRAIRDADRGGM